MIEIRLVFDGCGHIETWQVSQVPPDEPVDWHVPADAEHADGKCEECRPPYSPSIEMMADAGAASIRWRKRR